MINSLRAGNIVSESGMGVTHASCLSHVIQLALTELIKSIRITARNENIISAWKDEEDDRQRHTDAFEGDGVPWTLKKVCNNHCHGLPLNANRGRFAIFASILMPAHNDESASYYVKNGLAPSA